MGNDNEMTNKRLKALKEMVKDKAQVAKAYIIRKSKASHS
jgi:hypothetical protein